MIRHLLVIREGEESQEDNLKIQSVENFPKTWLWILRIFSTWLLLFMWIKVEKMLKLTNLTNRLNNQNHVWVLKIRPKTKNLNMASYDEICMKDHEETCFIRFWEVFYEIHMKMWFCNPGWKSWSHGVWWKKSFQVLWKNALSWENKWKWMRCLSFHTYKSFLTRKTWMEWKNLKNSS